MKHVIHKFVLSGPLSTFHFESDATGEVFEAGPGVKFLGLVRLSEELFHVFEVTP